MTGFTAALSADNGPRLAVQAGARERHLGCEVLFHGYLSGGYLSGGYLSGGYLSGRAALGRRLEVAGAPSAAHLLAAGYRRWGEALPRHVHGEYAARHRARPK